MSFSSFTQIWKNFNFQCSLFWLNCLYSLHYYYPSVFEWWSCFKFSWLAKINSMINPLGQCNIVVCAIMEKLTFSENTEWQIILHIVMKSLYSKNLQYWWNLRNKMSFVYMNFPGFTKKVTCTTYISALISGTIFVANIF